MNNQESNTLNLADANYLLKLLKLYQQYIIRNKHRFAANEFKMQNFNNIISSIDNVIVDLKSDCASTLTEQQIIDLYALIELVENELSVNHQEFLGIVESLDNNLNDFINRMQALKSIVIKMTAK